LALDTAGKVLKKNGIFVAKEFPSPDIDSIFDEYKDQFRKFERTRLKSTRSTSTEMYVIGTGFLGSKDKEENK